MKVSSFQCNARTNVVLNRVRVNLHKRGYKTIRSIGRGFRIFDDNGDRKIDRIEFYQGMSDMGAAISKREADALLNALDLN